MIKIYRTLSMTLLALTIATICHGQSKEDKKYSERAREVEKEILETPDPMFAVTTVSPAYSKSSAVVIAKKVDIFSDLKSKVKVSFFYGREVSNMIRYEMTIRERLKIQDKNALNEYSEIAFSKIRSQSSFFRRSTFSYTGISIIKPDGTIKKIDVDAEAVNAESDEEKNKYKIAMPGLEVGDIIDMYTKIEKESKADSPIDPLDIVFGGEYPVMKYSFSTRIRKDFAVIYTTANGTPEIKETRDNDFIFLKMDMQDITKTADALWMYERRELPVFKINIFPGATERASSKSFAPQKGQVLKALPKEWVDATLNSRLLNSLRFSADERVNYLKEAIKKLKKERNWNDKNTDSLISYIYYYGRFSFLYDYMAEEKIQIGLERNFASTGFDFYSYLIDAFRYFEIDYDIIFTVPRTTGTIYTATSVDEFTFFFRAKGTNQDYYLAPPHMYTLANSFPAVFEGQEAYVFKVTASKGAASSKIEKLPFTKPSFNFQEDNLDVTVNLSGEQKMDITRTRTVRGNSAYDDQATISLFEEYVDRERSQLGERSFSEEIIARVGKKRGTVLLDEYQRAFADARQKRLDYALKEAKNTFESESITLESVKVIQIGSRHDKPEFIFSEKLSLPGLIKKAGVNYIVDIGKLLTGQTQIKADQRHREYNIHMPYARAFSYNIKLTIPEGYTIEGLDNLNRQVSNETGGFASKASIIDDKLVVQVTKSYNHYYEKADQWSKMLAFLDLAFDFSQQKILLKKK